MRDLGTHLRHMQHEGRAEKWNRVKLFIEKLANAPQKNIPEKLQMGNGQWTHLMSEIKVFNMFKLLKVVLLCSLKASLHIMALDQNARTC